MIPKLSGNCPVVSELRCCCVLLATLGCQTLGSWHQLAIIFRCLGVAHEMQSVRLQHHGSLHHLALFSVQKLGKWPKLAIIPCDECNSNGPACFGLCYFEVQAVKGFATSLHQGGESHVSLTTSPLYWGRSACKPVHHVALLSAFHLYLATCRRGSLLSGALID